MILSSHWLSIALWNNNERKSETKKPAYFLFFHQKTDVSPRLFSNQCHRFGLKHGVIGSHFLYNSNTGFEPLGILEKEGTLPAQNEREQHHHSGTGNRIFFIETKRSLMKLQLE